MVAKQYFNPLTIAEWLRTNRKEKGLTQLQLAVEMNMSERTIRRYENDGFYNIDVLVDFANYFHTNVFIIINKAFSEKGMQDSCIPFHFNRTIFTGFAFLYEYNSRCKVEIHLKN